MFKNKVLYFIYQVVIIIGLPIAVLRLFYKSRKNPDYCQRIGERFAIRLPVQLPINNRPIWIHTVSVGEFLAVLPLIQSLQKKQSTLLITTTTPTGSAMVKEKLGNSVQHCYLPFDKPILVSKFLQHIQPSVAVFVETEIWANYLYALRKRGTPTFLINARLSEKSFQGYAKLGRFARETLSCFTEVACQNQLSQQRFQRLGAKATILGNIKFDLAPPENLSSRQIQLKKLLGDKPFVLVASTHKGEDEIILTAFQRSRYADTHRLIIAPRHPERSGEILAICHTAKVNTISYSQCNTVLSDDVQVMLIDKLGELLYFYSLADFAVIGGSFVPHGGHNPLEAALFSVPCIIGEHYFNFESLVNEMTDNNAIIVATAETLFVPRENLTIIGQNAQHFLADNQGALVRYERLILGNIAK